jgi:phosphatidate cytidylyltransferase
MLRWRLIFGIFFILVLTVLCWLDHLAPVPGMVLYPLCMLCVFGATNEILDLIQAGGLTPIRSIVHVANQMILLAGWIAFFLEYTGLFVFLEGLGAYDSRFLPNPLGWMLLALSAGIILAFVGEMRRYKKPGGVTINLAGAVFAMTYVGLLVGILVLIRMNWGLWGVLSVIVVVKMTDTGAYTVGRLIGKHKLVPILSPGKTIEGAVGGLIFACIGSCVVFTLMGSETHFVGWIVYGLLVGTAGVIGDLAESLIKRDVQIKDSSTWLPGFGGVLDILDSILIATPVAYLLWALGVVG